MLKNNPNGTSYFQYYEAISFEDHWLYNSSLSRRIFVKFFLYQKEKTNNLIDVTSIAIVIEGA